MALCVRKVEGHGVLAVLLQGPSVAYVTFLHLGAPPPIHPHTAEPFPPAPLAWPQQISCLSLSVLGLFGGD